MSTAKRTKSARAAEKSEAPVQPAAPESTKEKAEPAGSGDLAGRVARLEKELQDVMGRACLAITDARVAVDRVSQYRAPLEEASGKLDGLERALKDYRGELKELTRLAASMSERIAELETRGGEGDAGVGVLMQALEERLGELGRSSEERLRGLGQAFEERLMGVGDELRIQAEAIGRLMERRALPSQGETDDLQFEERSATSELSFALDDILQVMIRHDASDMHLGPGLPPIARINNELLPVGNQVLSERNCRRLVLPPLTSAQRRSLMDGREVTFTHYYEKVPFRVNAFRQRGSVSAVIKMRRSKIPSLEELGLPDEVRRLADLQGGLVLVAAPPGSGKSTTMAALLHHINTTRRVHIITLDSPARFAHGDIMSIVTQREVGVDTPTALDGLKAALLQDPDVICVAELDDRASVRAAVDAAAKGILVLAALPASHALHALSRLIAPYEGEARREFCQALAGPLKAVISLKLLERADMSGKVAAVEVMTATPEVLSLLREGKLGDIFPAMVHGARAGMRTFSVSLRQLFEQGVITRDEALRRAKELPEVTVDPAHLLAEGSSPPAAEEKRHPLEPARPHRPVDEQARQRRQVEEPAHPALPRRQAEEPAEEPDGADPQKLMMATLAAALPGGSALPPILKEPDKPGDMMLDWL